MRRQNSRDMGLVRFLIQHTVVGFVLASLFVGALLAFDLGGLGTLVLTSDVGMLALVLLTFFMGLSFAGAQTAFAVMMASRRDDEGTPGSAVLVPLRNEQPLTLVRRRS